MPDTIICPTCSKPYPFLPAMAGRKIRCSTCGAVLRIGGGGTVEEITPGQLPGTVRQPDRIAELTSTWVENAATRSARPFESDNNHTGVALGTTTRALSAREIALKRAVSANLNKAAAAAAAAEGGAQVTGAKKPHEGNAIPGPVLTAEGVRSARVRKRYVKWAVLLSFMVAALIWVMSSLRIEHEAIAVLRSQARALHDHRMEELSASFWFDPTGMLPRPLALYDVGTCTMREYRELELTAWGCLANYTPITWQYDEVLAAFVRRGLEISSIGDRSQRLEKLGKNAFAIEEISRLSVADEHPIVYQLIARLLLHPSFRPQLLSGGYPQHCSLAIIDGRDGTQLIDGDGGRRVFAQVPDYRAVVVRLSGPGWDDQWRILTVLNSAAFERLGDPLLHAAERSRRGLELPGGTMR